MAEKKQENVEREYVIPLRSKYQHVARHKKTPKAIKTIKEFLARHMKVYDKDLNKIKVEKEVNEFLWARGIKNPAHKVKVRVKKDGENYRVSLVDLPDKIKFKKLREEKIENEAKAKIESKKTMMEKAKESMQNKGKSEKKDKESADDKVEEKEKQKAVEEANEKIEKAMEKEIKHTAKVKTPKEDRQNTKPDDVGK